MRFRNLTKRGLQPMDGQPQPRYSEWHAAPGASACWEASDRQTYVRRRVLCSFRHLGDREVLNQEVDLTPGSPSLRVVYKTRSVRGSVENGEVRRWTWCRKRHLKKRPA